MLPILPLRINRTDLGLSVKIVLRKQSLRQIFIFGFLSETQTEVSIARVRWPGGVVGVGASRHLYKGKAEMADALTTHHGHLIMHTGLSSSVHSSTRQQLRKAKNPAIPGGKFDPHPRPMHHLGHEGGQKELSVF